MKDLNISEENYLKSIWSGAQEMPPQRITQAVLARQHQHSRPSAHKIIHKLTDLGLIQDETEGTIKLTGEGEAYAVALVRRHRLWEVFLVDKLGYNWAEVHEIAEKLEHIGNTTLTERLEDFLNFPRFDPHGDPIPDRNGSVEKTVYMPLAECALGAPHTIVGVKEQSASFLEYMQHSSLKIGTKVEVVSKLTFDGSLIIRLISDTHAQSGTINLSPFAADHIIVE